MAVVAAHQPSSAMSPSSNNIAVESPSARSSPKPMVENKAEMVLRRMQSNLSRYSRANDRRMVLRSLRDLTQLGPILLEAAEKTDGPLFDLEREVAEQNVVVNGILFQAVKVTCDGKYRGGEHTPVGLKHSCIPLLKGLCGRLCDKDGIQVSRRAVYEKLVVRLARTTASAGPYFRLSTLLANSDLVLMPIDSENHGKVLSTPTTRGAHTKPPIPGKKEPLTINKSMSDDQNSNSQRGLKEKPSRSEISLYESNGNVHATINETYVFGLYRRGHDVTSGKPWIVFEAVVHERTNFCNNNCVRSLKIKLPDLY